MNYNEFLERIISDGIVGATSDYTDEKDKHRLEGSVAGFNACHNKTPTELLEVWKEAQQYTQEAYFKHDDVDRYWRLRCYQLEVEWVCNVVSAMLYNQELQPILSWMPTCNGMQKAASIIGISEISSL